MTNLVDRLMGEDHPVELSLRPDRDLATLRERLDLGYVHILFPTTRGGTELGVRLDSQESDLSRGDLQAGSGEIVLVGSLVLDFVPVTCRAVIDVETFSGVGRLSPAAG